MEKKYWKLETCREKLEKSRFQRLRLVKQYTYVVLCILCPFQDQVVAIEIRLIYWFPVWVGDPVRCATLLRVTYWLLALRDRYSYTLHILCLFDGKFIRHGLVVTKLCGANALSIVMMGFCVNRREETFFFLHALTPDNELRFTRTITEIFSLYKVNSVQEACTKCFAVHISKFEILQTTWKNKIKNIKMLDLLVKNWKLRVWGSLFHFFHVICKISNFNMWTAKHLAQASRTGLTLNENRKFSEFLSINTIKIYFFTTTSLLLVRN